MGLKLFAGLSRWTTIKSFRVSRRFNLSIWFDLEEALQLSGASRGEALPQLVENPRIKRSVRALVN